MSDADRRHGLRQRLRQGLAILNYLTIVVLAALVIAQIWFRLWDGWEILLKTVATYLVVLLGALALYHSNRIFGVILPSDRGAPKDGPPDARN